MFYFHNYSDSTITFLSIEIEMLNYPELYIINFIINLIGLNFLFKDQYIHPHLVQ